MEAILDGEELIEDNVRPAPVQHLRLNQENQPFFPCETPEEAIRFQRPRFFEERVDVARPHPPRA